MKFAVIPSAGRHCLVQSIAGIYNQVDKVIIIDTDKAGDWLPQGDPKLWRFPCNTKHNISHWWNEGLDLASQLVQDEDTWDVAIINDDAIVPPDWFVDVSAWMRDQGAVAGSAGTRTHVLHQPTAVPLHWRMQGFAFILAGEKQLRADEEFHWWAGDDDLDWRSREAGGMAMLSGPPVEHLYPNGQVTPELQARIALDMQYFVDKWGRRPW